MKNSKLKLNWIAIMIAIFTLQNNFSMAQGMTLQLDPSDYNGFHVACFGGNNGWINLTVNGGTPPFTYEWSNGANTEDVADLPQGYLHVTVTDINNNTAEAEITLTEPRQIVIEFTVSQYIIDGRPYEISLHGACNGSITALVTEGVAPYTYLWDPGNQTTANITNVCAGDYRLRVTDANGCITGSGQLMTQPDRSDWQMTGNANSNPSTHFIGTTDGQDLSLRTNNLERMRISSIGDVKINSLAGQGEFALGIDNDGKIVAVNPALPCGPVTPVFPVWRVLPNPNWFIYLCPVQSKLGIGTTFPKNKIDVLGNAAIGAAFAGVQNAPANGLIVSGKVGIGTAVPTANFEVNWSGLSDGSVAFVGPDPPAYLAPLPISGAGNRLMWLPDYGAFRAGYVSANQWDAVGPLTFAIGENTQAYGNRSFAMGNSTTTNGYNSFAGGNNSNTSGDNSIAFGDFAFALGLNSFAVNDHTRAIGVSSFASGFGDVLSNTGALGPYSATFGYNTTVGVNGFYAAAFGDYTLADHSSAFASGTHTTASGIAAFSTGNYTTASGWHSASMGTNTFASSYSELVIGRGNEMVTGTSNSWVPSDPIFQIGIQDNFPNNQLKNAMTVLKNGNVGIGQSAPTHQLELSTDQAAMLGGGPWLGLSDKRLKADIMDYTKGLAELKKIHPISYRYNGVGGLPTKQTFVGVIAQEIQEILPNTVKSTKVSRLQEEYLEFDGNELTYVLINSVKELSDEVDKIKEDNKKLNEQLIECCTKPINLNNSITLPNFEKTQSNQIDVLFFENKIINVIPNPFNNSTIIKYHLTSAINSAVITFQNTEGKIISSNIINEKTDGQYIFEGSNFESGIYFCTLWIDSRKCDTRLLVLNK